jgi:2,4-dienoyl-CoA reductase-like NADH-dependent reductase (Old Yellow Enzyme family)
VKNCEKGEKNMSVLFSPLTINGITLRNRVVVPPMCQYSAADGMASDWHLVHYGSIAAGGAGTVIVEATAISPEGRITPYDLGLWNDAQANRISKILGFIATQGAVPAIQLTHAGRKACTDKPWLGGKPLGNWKSLLAPSAIAFDDLSQTPQELTTCEISELVEKFAESALRAVRAGAAMVELHAAHGYLLHQFLSPLANRREDAYGSTFDNRCRFLIEAVKAVQSALGSGIPVAVRISATDWAEGGFTPKESVMLSVRLKSLGVAFMDVSTAGIVPWAKIPAAPGFQVPFAEKIRQEVGMTVSAVGLVTTPAQAEEIVASGRADIVMVGRGHLKNHQWAIHAAKELGAAAPVPSQYLRAYL